ncbi:hypothetical protein [Treponema sp. R80B11-R83G3]
MGIVRHTSNGTEPLSEEDMALYEEMENSPIDFSDDPSYTREELHKMRLYAEERRRRKVRKMYSLRLESGTVKWWQSLGKGYTSIMAKFLDYAKKHPEWVKESIENATT